MPRRIGQHLRRFARDGRGSVSIEAAFMLPALFFVIIAMVVFFDVYRIENTNAKAAYAVADLLSRQIEPVDEDYLEGLNNVYAALARARHSNHMRVSSIDYDFENMRYRILWSYGTRDTAALTAEELDLWEDQGRLPALSVGETIILVETVLDHVPLLDLGIGERVFSHLIPTRPRFVPRLLFDAGST